MDKNQALELAKKLAPEILKIITTDLSKDPSQYTPGYGYEEYATPEQVKLAIQYFTEALKGAPKEI